MRIDVSNQSLTSTQKTNALTNLGITATVAELNYTDGVTSNIQTQLDAKGTSSFSGSYNDLSDKPTIPTNNNQLTNGAGYITSSSLSSYATSTDLTDGTITKINSQATVGDSIEFFQNDGGGNLGIRFNANYNSGNYSVEDGSAWEFQFNNDSTSGDFLIYYDGSISAADEAITWVEGLRLDGGDSSLYIFGDKVWDAGNLTNLNQLTNGPGYITGITSSDVTTALGYTPGTSSFSGSYNDLSNKPTIPTNNNQLTNGAGYITSSSLSGYQPRTLERSSRNLVFATGTTGSGGIFLEQSDGSALIQLYSDGTNYGFLWGEWGGWDIKKADGGPLYIDISGTLREVYHTGNLTVGGGTPYLDLSTANYGTVKVDDDRGVGWAGYTIRDDWSLMSNGATTFGIYNDTDNEWMLRCERNGQTDLRYNGTTKLVTDASGITVEGRIDCTSQTAYVARNYGHGIFGVYSATRYQHVWSMGTAYNLSADGTGVGDLYGISWTHTNIGTGTNQSISGLSHQMQIRGNGNLWSAIGYGIWTVGNVCAYSDIAVKENIVKIDNALDKVKQINGYTFDRIDAKQWNEEKEDNVPVRQAGVIAQEIEKVLPEVVNGEEGNKSVSYGNVVALLIEAIKEQQEQIEELKERLQ